MTYPEFTLRLFDRFEASHADLPLQGLNLREGERLLAYLTLCAGRPVPYHEMAEQFWPGEARQALEGGGDLASTRQAIHALRTSLGPNAARITSPRKGTLLLDFGGADVDLLSFDRFVAAGDSDSLRSAAALYRGPLLGEWREPWALSARKQREREYHGLLQRLLDTETKVGHVVEQEKWLRRLLALRSQDQAVARQLICLLREANRPKEARDIVAAMQETLRARGDASDAQTLALHLRAAADITPQDITDDTEAKPDEEVKLEPVGGAVALESSFYVARTTDGPFMAALEQGQSIVLIHGARQMGKTSLLARGLNRVRQRGARVLLTDFQSLSEARFASPDSLYLNLAVNLAAQQEIEFSIRVEWSEDRDANLNFERFVSRRILNADETPVVWGMDEVDRLFAYPFASEVFGLMRSWHNRRALDPEGPWSRLTLAIAYSTEAHLFIKDANQSPFNVGTRIVLSDFSIDQVAELNQRYGSPLLTQQQIECFKGIVGGHPYLSRVGLNALARKEATLEQLADAGDGDGGPFQDHLNRTVFALKSDPILSSTALGVINSEVIPPLDIFYRLRSAGILTGRSPNDCRIRCKLYADYFARHL